MMDIVNYQAKSGTNNLVSGEHTIFAHDMSREHFTRLIEELSFRGVNPADAIDRFNDVIANHQEFFFTHDSSAPNTQRNYENALVQLRYWLEEYQGYDVGVIPLPMSVDLLCEYITWRATECPALRGGNSTLSYYQRVEAIEHKADDGFQVKRGVSKNTLALDIYSINRLHQASCLPSPTRTEAFRMIHKRLLRQKIENKEQFDVQTSVLTENYLQQINSYCSGSQSILELRDCAILNLNFEAMLRGIEATKVEIKDLQLFPDGSANLSLLADKTNKTGIPRYLSLSRKCMSHINEYLKACDRNLNDDGYLFAAINSNFTTRNNKTPVSRKVIEGAFDRAFTVYTDAHKSGLIEKFTTHSTRIGAAIYLSEQGFTHLEILTNGRWKSLTMLSRYLEKGRATGAMHKARRYL